MAGKRAAHGNPEVARQRANEARAAAAEAGGAAEAGLDRTFNDAMAGVLEQWLQPSAAGVSPFFSPGATSPDFVSMHPAGGSVQGEAWVPNKAGWAPPEGTAPKPMPSPLTRSLIDALKSSDGVVQQHFQLENRLMLHGCSAYCLTKWHKLVEPVLQVVRWCKKCRLHFGYLDPDTKTMTGMDKHEFVAMVIRVAGGSPRYDGRRDHGRKVASIVATLVRHSPLVADLTTPT